MVPKISRFLLAKQIGDLRSQHNAVFQLHWEFTKGKIVYKEAPSIEILN